MKRLFVVAMLMGCSAVLANERFGGETRRFRTPESRRERTATLSECHLSNQANTLMW